MSSCLLYKSSILVIKPAAGTCFKTHLPIDKCRWTLHDGFKEPPNAHSSYFRSPRRVSSSELHRYPSFARVEGFVVPHFPFRFFFVGVLWLYKLTLWLWAPDKGSPRSSKLISIFLPTHLWWSLLSELVLYYSFSLYVRFPPFQTKWVDISGYLLL